MDPNAHLNTPTPAPNSRKRSRENETPAQRHKREKAAERQRRKRERDRQAGLNSILSLAQVQQQPIPPPETPVSAPPAMQEYSKAPGSDDLSPEDMARRERMRSAARERQRKHRALVKQRKLRELGLDMGNEIMPAMDEVQYRMNAAPENTYTAVMPHEMQAPPPPHQHQQHPQHPHPMHEPPFPQGQPLGGQTFASTLLLSFSCAPLLKQHLLRTLSMTNEELASLEPIIASAWDQWDQQRRMHYGHIPANAPKPPEPEQQATPTFSMPEHAGGSGTMQPSASTLSNAAASMSQNPFAHDSNDFRTRFHRPLVAPSPFRSAMESAHGSGMNGVVEGAQGDTGLDPHLTTKSAVAMAMDAQLGQARDEAASVAGKLDR
ncbi:hypothetical protein EIP91_000932 [Steccherinum ochraceum]|uniref:Uncharacterized protein n=1 Tax=Steccherinum ochraceum TaxID=92696 RepID=A0A4R0RHD5_9APHY|nr:hypothetical protein EIP91_000932 [Steccherinum ochraceum]